MGETKYRSNVRHLTLWYDLEYPKAMNFTSTRRKIQET